MHRILRISVRIVLALLLLFQVGAYQGSLASLESRQGDAGVNLAVVDELGLPFQSIEPRENISIRSDITNHAEQRMSFIHVVQIKDPGNKVAFLDLTAFDLNRGETRTAESTWQAEIEGNHTIQAFAWQNVRSPSTFSFISTLIRINLKSDLPTRCSGSASCFTGIVAKVIDGDTIRVNNLTIRFALVDTPERGEVGYDEATSFTARLCAQGSEVVVDEDDGQRSGSYGRMIAKVYCGGRVINEELLASQNAIILVEFCTKSEFALEAWAKSYGC